MKKKVIIISLIVLVSLVVLALIVALVREASIHNLGRLDRSNPMTREEVVELLQRGANHNNYYYAPDIVEGEMFTETFVKDGIIATFLNSEIISWSDTNNNEFIHFWYMDERRFATISYDIQLEYNQAGYDFSIIADTENFSYDFRYLGVIEEDGRSVIVIQLTDRDPDSESRGFVRFYIDRASGLIIRRTDVARVWFVTTWKYTNNRNVQLNVVTAEDVQRPDLSEFETFEDFVDHMNEMN